jgi:threonine aldolase
VRRVNGEMIDPALLREISSYAKGKTIKLHLDGARLLLAPPAVDVRAYARPFDTVYVSLYKYLGAPFGAVLAGSTADIAEARELRHVFGGTLYEGWMPAMLARDALSRFRDDIGRAHALADALVAALVASGKVRDATSPNASNIRMLEMDEAFAQAAFERGRLAGVRIGRWRDGRVPLFVNTTLLRRPLDEYAGLFLG